MIRQPTVHSVLRNTVVNSVKNMVALDTNLNQTINTIARNISMVFSESNSDSIPYSDTSLISESFDADYKNYLNYKLLISL